MGGEFLMTPSAPGRDGPAKVVLDDDGLSWVLFLGDLEMEWDVSRTLLDHRATLINRALSPLVARAGMAERFYDCLRYQVSVGIPISMAEKKLMKDWDALQTGTGGKEKANG